MGAHLWIEEGIGEMSVSHVSEGLRTPVRMLSGEKEYEIDSIRIRGF